MSRHIKFILTPVETNLEEAIGISCAFRDNIATYPVKEHFLQSVFLKITGFMEQKMKCICWELATDDYEYRYERYSARGLLGECSCYDEKKKVFVDLVKQLRKRDRTFEKFTDAERQAIWDESAGAVEQFHRQWGFVDTMAREYAEFKTLTGGCSKDCIGYTTKTKWSDTEIITEPFNRCANCPGKGRGPASSICPQKYSLEDCVTATINHRNRCAHNTLSYQYSPTVDRIVDNSGSMENYYLRFLVMIAMDKMFVRLFKKYLDAAPGSPEEI